MIFVQFSISVLERKLNTLDISTVFFSGLIGDICRKNIKLKKRIFFSRFINAMAVDVFAVKKKKLQLVSQHEPAKKRSKKNTLEFLIIK